MKFLQDFQKIAIGFGDTEYSYADLLNQADSYSIESNNHVKEKNSADKTGSRIAIFMENRPEWAFALYGIWKSGGVALPIDFMSTPEEIKYIIDDCQPEAIYCSEKTWDLINSAIEISSHKPSLVNVDNTNFIESSKTDYPDFDDNAIAVIIYTSGTTGTPKGVMLTFQNIGVVCEVLGSDKYDPQGIMYSKEESYITILPLHHIYPLQGTLIGPLFAGSTVCMIKEITADNIFEACSKYKVTRILGVPRLYEMFHKGIMSQINKKAIARLLFKIAGKINSRKFSAKLFSAVQKKFGGNIRALMSGGSKLDPELAKDFHTLGFRVLEGYGMTETSPSMTMCDLKRYKLGSVGYKFPCGEIKITDKDEFCYKGPNVMKGYFNRPEDTKAVFDEDGWFHTGDKVSIDAEGFYRITGRLKDIIILKNGKNVNPEHIENSILKKYDLIKEIGIIEKNDVLFAIIHPNFEKIREESIVNIKETIKWEIIDKYNVSAPHHMKILDFKIVDLELPKTRVGKLKRFELTTLAENQTTKEETFEEPDTEEYTLLKETIENMLGYPVTASQHIELDLNMDSLDRVELQARIENNFGIHLSNEELSHHPRIHELASHIKEMETDIKKTKTDWSSILKQTIHFKVPKRIYMMRLLLLVTKPIRTFYFKIVPSGIKNIPLNQPVIFTPNHQSFLDGIILISLLKRRTRKKTYFFAKDRNFNSPFKRYFAKKANIILLNINKDLKETLQQMAAIIKNDNNIVIFPEGARTRNGELQDFKKTFAILSRELQIPIVPVAIDGSYSLLSIKSKIPKPGKIHVSFLEKIEPGELQYEEIVSKTHSAVKNKLNKK